MLTKITRSAKAVFNKLTSAQLVALCCMLALCGSSLHAEEGTVTLPAVPVDFAALGTAGLTTVSSVITVVAGIAIVVGLSYMGIRKLMGAFRGKA